MTDEEAYRVLMGALPLKDREKVLMEEKRLLSHKKLLLMEGWPQVGEVAMLNWLHGHGFWPKKVKVVPLGFEVEVHTEELFFKLMALSAKFLQGSSTPLKVTALDLPEHLTAMEVANLMKGWLKDKESSREFDRPNYSNKSSAPSKPQWNSEARVFGVEA